MQYSTEIQNTELRVLAVVTLSPSTWIVWSWFSPWVHSTFKEQLCSRNNKSSLRNYIFKLSEKLWLTRMTLRDATACKKTLAYWEVLYQHWKADDIKKINKVIKKKKKEKIKKERKTYQQNWTKCLGWLCHVDWTIITDHFRHVRKSSTVIQVKVTYYDTV